MINASKTPCQVPAAFLPSDEPPVSRLPPEVLEVVFELCLSWFYAHQKPKNRLAWMQVCKAWQNIGLNSGRLWQYIDFEQLSCVSVSKFLARSKQAPLFITATSPIRFVPLDLALHSSRLRFIDVTLRQTEMIELFVSVGRDLPVLTDLFLKMIPTTSTTLDLSLPSLRRLSLAGVSIRWEECHNLTYFSLGRPNSFFPSLSRILAIFRSSPDLEYVRLEGFSPPVIDTVEFPPITLSHLEDFVISSFPSVIKLILSVVDLGMKTRLQLFVAMFESLHSIFPPRRLGVFKKNLQPVSAEQDVNTVRMSQYGVYFIQGNAPGWCDDPSFFRISLSSASSTSMHVYNSLDCVMEPSFITRLELNVGVLFDISHLAVKTLFSELRRLQSLCTALNEIGGLLAVLASIDKTTNSVYLPQLVRLSFGRPTDRWRHFGDRWSELIVDALGTRRERSCGLQILEFCNCEELAPAMLVSLEKVADEVIQVFEH